MKTSADISWTSSVAHPSGDDSSVEHENSSSRRSLQLVEDASINMNDGDGDGDGDGGDRNDSGTDGSSFPPQNSVSKSFSSTSNMTITASNTNSDSNKKRRIGEQMSSTTASSSRPSSSWQDFCRKGARFKILLDDALVKVASSAIDSSSSQQQKQQQQSSEEGEDVGVLLNARVDVNKNNTNGSNRLLHKIFEGKQIECLLLQQKVDSQHSEMTQLQAIVDDLRESKMQQAAAETRIRIALKQASQNATTAREEANEAEANAAALVAKVEAFETVVVETKRASMLLLKEQEEIGVGVEGMELEFVQAQADLARSNANKQKMQQEQRKLNRRLLRMKDRMDDAQDSLEHEQNEKLLVVRKSKELEATLQIQENRSKRLQDELNSTQALLVEATSSFAESRASFDGCKQALDRMSEANQHLHQQLQESQTMLQKEKASHQLELTRTLKDYQATLLQVNDQKDLFQKLKLEKLAGDKEKKSLSSKICSLERRLQDSTNLIATPSVFPSTPNNNNNNNTVGTANDTINSIRGGTSNDEGSNRQHSNTGRGFTIPRLGGKENESTSMKCAICRASSSGLMRKCQCGRKDCFHRAHATCCNRISSHTPSFGQLLVLCSTTGVSSSSSNNMGSSNPTAITPKKMKISYS